MLFRSRLFGIFLLYTTSLNPNWFKKVIFLFLFTFSHFSQGGNELDLKAREISDLSLVRTCLASLISISIHHFLLWARVTWVHTEPSLVDAKSLLCLSLYVPPSSHAKGLAQSRCSTDIFWMSENLAKHSFCIHSINIYWQITTFQVLF